MTDLQKRLRHLLAFYGHPGIDLDQAVADVEGAIEGDGYVKPLVKWVSKVDLENDPKYNPRATLKQQLDEAVMETIYINKIDDSGRQKVHPRWFVANGQTFTFGVDIGRIKTLLKDAARSGNAYGEIDGHLMTGQEWYDRFVALAPTQLTEADELDFNLHDDDPDGNCYYAYNCAVDEVKRAAKKASGIK